MSQPVVNARQPSLSALFVVAALVVAIIGALLGFGVFGSVTLLQLGAIVCTSLACWFAAALV